MNVAMEIRTTITMCMSVSQTLQLSSYAEEQPVRVLGGKESVT